MTLLKFAPFRNLETLDNEIKKFFVDFPEATAGENEIIYQPRIDISEDEKNIHIEAELPGVKKEDVKLTLEKNILSIDGEKKNITVGEKKYFRNERIFGKFNRKFTIPTDISIKSVSAEFADGILNINIEKKIEKPAQERTIEIK
ncbi:MAG: Hsp20/alpha crystallin family protein [Ignavibacteriaceae bacterium]|nr:Hsp20/alpha crystallin family protein [Ignavibacteriaceae bacterium]